MTTIVSASPQIVVSRRGTPSATLPPRRWLCRLALRQAFDPTRSWPPISIPVGFCARPCRQAQTGEHLFLDVATGAYGEDEGEGGVTGGRTSVMAVSLMNRARWRLQRLERSFTNRRKGPCSSSFWAASAQDAKPLGL
jgi:hypothetical protein